MGSGERRAPNVSDSADRSKKLEVGTDLYLGSIRWKVLVVSAKAKSKRCEGKNVHQVTQEEMRTEGLGT